MGAQQSHGDLNRTVKELLPQSRAGWGYFTKAVLWGIISVAAILILMLLFLYQPEIH